MRDRDNCKEARVTSEVSPEHGPKGFLKNVSVLSSKMKSSEGKEMGKAQYYW